MTRADAIAFPDFVAEGDVHYFGCVPKSFEHEKRRSTYTGVPAKACALTAGVDVQKDRLDVEIVAWAEDEESWSIAYERLYGDPSKDELWNQLEAFLQTEHAHFHAHFLDWLENGPSTDSPDDPQLRKKWQVILKGPDR